VEGPVDLAVAAPVEPHPARLARARRDGGDAGQHREGIGRAEAADVADLAEELGGHERTGAPQRAQRVVGHQPLDAAVELTDLGRQLGQADETTAGQLGLDAGAGEVR
jgi:hypothetical protein